MFVFSLVNSAAPFYMLLIASCIELRDKVTELLGMYDKIKENTEDRNRALENTLGVSEKFWDDLNGLAGTLKDVQDTLASLEAPALDPSTIREQQETLEVSQFVKRGT